MKAEYAIVNAYIHEGQVVVKWTDKQISRLNYMWLRDNCKCEECGSHDSGSRLQRLLEIPENICPSMLLVEKDNLTITWNELGHKTSYQSDWLRKYSSDTGHSMSTISNRIVWDSSLTKIPVVDYRKALVYEEELRKLFFGVARFGFAHVLNMGTNYDEIETLGALIGYIRETHYGRVFDLKMRAKAEILADLPKAILPHTDETYRHVPLGINIFHCICASSEGGGETILVDSFRVAQIMEEKYPEGYQLLCKTPIQHERRIKGQVLRSHHPVFALDYYGNLVEVRLNERTMSAIYLPIALMDAAYKALRQVFSIAYDPANQLRYRLNPGEALVFDNLRNLHGRTGFDLANFTGERLIRQAQVMRDEFYGKYFSYLDDFV